MAEEYCVVAGDEVVEEHAVAACEVDFEGVVVLVGVVAESVVDELEFGVAGDAVGHCFFRGGWRVSWGSMGGLCCWWQVSQRGRPGE